MERERLFATEKLGGRALYRFHAFTVFAGICLVLYYRATRVPASGEGRAAWLGMLAVELWYSFFWVLSQSVRWSPVRRRAFKDRLAARMVRYQVPMSEVHGDHVTLLGRMVQALGGPFPEYVEEPAVGGRPCRVGVIVTGIPMAPDYKLEYFEDHYSFSYYNTLQTLSRQALTTLRAHFRDFFRTTQFGEVPPVAPGNVGEAYGPHGGFSSTAEVTPSMSRAQRETLSTLTMADTLLQYSLVGALNEAEASASHWREQYLEADLHRAFLISAYQPNISVDSVSQDFSTGNPVHDAPEVQPPISSLEIPSTFPPPPSPYVPQYVSPAPHDFFPTYPDFTSQPDYSTTQYIQPTSPPGHSTHGAHISVHPGAVQEANDASLLFDTHFGYPFGDQTTIPGVGGSTGLGGEDTHERDGTREGSEDP